MTAVLDLVPGDPGALFADANDLRRQGEAFDTAAEAVRRLDVGDWRGPAADACADALVVLRRDLLRRAEGCDAAARALERHAYVLTAAQRRAGEAHARMLETAAVPGGGVVDALADEEVRDALDAVDRSAAATANHLDALADMPLPGGPAGEAVHVQVEYQIGLHEGLWNLVASAVAMSPLRAALDPVGADEDRRAVLTALLGAIDDPLGFLQQLTDWETWQTNPFRAGARLVPDILTSLGTGGTAAAVGRLGKLGRLADKADDVTPGRATGPSRPAAASEPAPGAVPGRQATPPAGTEEAIREALLELPRGRSHGIRQVPNAAELKELFDIWSRGGSAAPKPTYDGIRIELPDGTVVGLRHTSESGGPTIDINFPNGRQRKVHIGEP